MVLYFVLGLSLCYNLEPNLQTECHSHVVRVTYFTVHCSVEDGMGDDLNGDGLGVVDSGSCCLFGSTLP